MSGRGLKSEHYQSSDGLEDGWDLNGSHFRAVGSLASLLLLGRAVVVHVVAVLVDIGDLGMIVVRTLAKIVERMEKRVVTTVEIIVVIFAESHLKSSVGKSAGRSAGRVGSVGSVLGSLLGLVSGSVSGSVSGQVLGLVSGPVSGPVSVHGGMGTGTKVSNVPLVQRKRFS